MEDKPAGVSKETKQAGEIRGRWSWVEPCVWTDRMLTALEKGVKGGKWFSLIDKVYSKTNLRKAFEGVKEKGGKPGVDHQTISQFESRLEKNLNFLHKSLKAGTYQPQAIKRVWIPKPGRKERRPLGIPTVRDRVVQKALLNVLEPIFEKTFAETSYGFRPGRSAHDALEGTQDKLKEGHKWVVDVDLKSYFDSIPHQPLLEKFQEEVSDGRVINLLEKYLKQEVMNSIKEVDPANGTPQGAVISPLLSNIYLNGLDWHMQRQGYEMIRYADDFVILCKSHKEAQKALEEVRDWASDADLTLHPEKTCIVNINKEGFDFLGYHFEQGY